MIELSRTQTGAQDQWGQLLSDKRIGFKNGSIAAIDRVKSSDPLSEFLYDSNRIIYTSAFRRMQHKTQVYSLPNTDYVRNRLTHTIEVAQIGYFLGAMVGHWLEEKRYLPPGKAPADVADVVYNACLIHDIGNPPFGHVGEEAIRNWFKANQNKGLLAQISDDDRQDFLRFDGNAQGLRVVTRTQGWRQEGGMRLSAAVLGAFIKYPYTAACLEKEKKFYTKKNKFGVFQEDVETAEIIFNTLGIKKTEKYKKINQHWCRHPLVYLVEAADDIAYHATDIEDGYKAGSISFDRAHRLMSDLVDADVAPSMGLLEQRARLINDRNTHDSGHRDNLIQYLRSGMIETLSRRAYKSFIAPANYAMIMNGQMGLKSLMDCDQEHSLESIKDECSNNVYYKQSKLRQEVSGFNVIQTILTEIHNMIISYNKCDRDYTKMPKKMSHLYRLFPVNDFGGLDKGSYNQACIMLDYVSGMTDTYAVEFHKMLTGHSSRMI